MRQVLLNNYGAVVARMPRPPVEPDSVLIRVRYSLISVGTELAALRPTPILDNLSLVNARASAVTASRYLKAALLNPRKAAYRARQLVRMKLGHLRASQPAGSPGTGETSPTQTGSPPSEPSELGDQGWNVGYSVAGEVVAVGPGVADLAVGDRVAAAGAGRANHADFVSVHRNLVCRVPAGTSFEAAASATVGSIALQGLRRAEPQLAETVAVLGLGLIGQITVQLLAANGCTVMGLDLDPARVTRAHLGPAHGASDPEFFKKLVHDATRGLGVDRCLIAAATKSDEVINLAMEVTRAKGRVVIVGDVGLNVQRAAFYRKEIDLLMSTSYGPGRYDRAYEEEGHDYPVAYVRWTLNRNMQAYLELVAKGALDVARLVDKVVDVRDAPSVYRELAQGGEGVPLGVLLSYSPPDTPGLEDARITVKGHREAPAGGRVRWALVGVGGFGTGMLVPQLQKLHDRFFLRGVVSRDAARGGNFARANAIEVLATDLDAVLQDPEFDLVVIATRHHEHSDQVVRCLKSGKHVFVEKPLALSWSELDQVASTYAALVAQPILMVGFNRRFSPALQRLAEVLRDRRSPVIVQYRVNAGYIAPDHWVQDARGGGRNLGEACHMYDVFRFLVKGSLTSISARSIDPGSLPYKRTDNFVATLSYEDGSVANLVYTALGPKQGLPKERIEVFADGHAYVVDDFKALTRSDDGAVLWQAAEADKGHFEELRRLGEAIVGKAEPPIPFEEIVETTAVALAIEDLLHGRTEGGLDE